MKKISNILIMLAIILSDIMCAVVAYNYRGVICCIEHMGYSVPAHLAFLHAIPFVVGIIACVVLAIRFRKRCASSNEQVIFRSTNG